MGRCGRRRLLAALIALVVLTGAACGGGGGGGSKASGSASKANPLVIGLINLEGSPGGSVKPLRLGVEAAVASINAEHNGVHGRPIKLDTCITSSYPEVSAACARRMVEHKAVAVIGGVDIGSAASLPILTAAGIPYIGSAPLLAADYTTNGAFMMDPGGMGATAFATVVDNLHAHRVTILRADDAPANQLTDVFAKPALLAHGVAARDIAVVPEKADAADLTPSVAAAARTNPDAIFVLFPPPACARVMQAAATLSVKAPMVYIGRCGDPAILKAGGAGANGIYFFSSLFQAEANANEPDVREYVKAARKYGSKELDPASFDTARGFATTMTAYKRLLTIDSDKLSAATVAAAFRSAVNQHTFMGRSYTCDGYQAIPAWVTVCNVWVRVYQYKDGHYRDALGKWVSAAQALTNK